MNGSERDSVRPFVIIKDSEIQSGVLVVFDRNRIQTSTDLDQRAAKLDGELARIVDPPFNADQSRVNIEKVFDPSINVGVKPKYLTLAKSSFDESALAPSPSQELKLEIFKVPRSQPIGETIIKQIILANRLENCDRVFLMFRPRTLDSMQTVLKNTQKCNVYLTEDPQVHWKKYTESPEYVIRFLDKILSPFHLDSDTLDDFRELVANHVFSYYRNYDAEFFDYHMTVGRNTREHPPRSIKMLHIFYRNLQRDQPTICPQLEVMRDDFVNYTVVVDLLQIIMQRCSEYDASSTVSHLLNLYKLMGTNTGSTKAIWDSGRDNWTDRERVAAMAFLICRKAGLEIPSEVSCTKEEILGIAMTLRMKMIRGWRNLLRADEFNQYWKRLYHLKQSGFTGRIAIVNRDYILKDSWIQSLFGIFGRDNTVIERVTEL